MKITLKAKVVSVFASLAFVLFSSSAFAWNFNPFAGIIKAITDTAVLVVATAAGISITAAKNLIAQASQLVTTQDVFGAEPGNYNVVTTAINMLYPKAPDRTLSASDQTLPYPIPSVGQQIDRKLNFVWQKVQLPQSTGAKCANGSDYKFFVNLTPSSNNFVIFMEPGGACNSYASCKGAIPKLKPDGSVVRDNNNVVVTIPNQLGASNPDGISDAHMNLIESALAGKLTQAPLISPMISRLSIADDTRFKMQNWNMVYMPYCSADVHTGDKTHVFTSDYDADQKVMHFKGMHNTLATLGWMRTNLPRPAQALLFGQSAGSVGAELMRPIISKVLSPSDSFYTLADSGFMTPEDPTLNNTEAFPASRFIGTGKKVWWGLDEQNPNKRTPIKMLQALAPNIDPKNLSSYGAAVHQAFPNDRMLYVVAQNDKTIPSFAYGVNPAFRAAALADGDINTQVPLTYSSNLALYERQGWKNDWIYLAQSVNTMNKNTGYFIPSGRRLIYSHVLTALTYEGSVNAETGRSVSDAINSLMDRSRPVVREVEKDPWTGLKAKLGPLTTSLNQVASALGITYLLLPIE